MAARVRLWLVLLLLAGLQFALRPRLGDPRMAPDFVMVALLLFAMRYRPGLGAVAGFLVGVSSDALAPTAFGAAALAHTTVGFLAGLSRTLFVADNVIVVGLLALLAAWLRDAIQVLAAHQITGRALAWQLLGYSPLSALATAAAAFVTLLLFRGWLAVRSEA